MYSGTWASREELEREFQISLTPNIQIIFAHYSGYSSADESDYEMWAHVLFRDASDGKLYEVHASHCSCMGLEDQWEPSEVNIRDVIRELSNPSNFEWTRLPVVRDRLKQALIALK